MNLRQFAFRWTLALAGGVSTIAAGSAADDPVKFLERSFDEAFAAVYDQPSASEPLSTRLRPLVERHFDLEYTTRSAVGPAWTEFTPEQQRKTIDLFTQLVLRTYADRFQPSAKRPTIVFGAPLRTGSRCEVPATLTYGGEMFSVAFRLRLVNDAWRFYDIIAENISMVRNYREQFEGIVGNGGPEALLRSLEDSVKRPPAAK